MASENWTGNSNSIFKTLGASSHTNKEREVNDYYATDPIAGDFLIELEKGNLSKDIWEPSAGEKVNLENHIVLKMRKYNDYLPNYLK